MSRTGSVTHASESGFLERFWNRIEKIILIGPSQVPKIVFINILEKSVFHGYGRGYSIYQTVLLYCNANDLTDDLWKMCSYSSYSMAQHNSLHQSWTGIKLPSPATCSTTPVYIYRQTPMIYPFQLRGRTNSVVSRFCEQVGMKAEIRRRVSSCLRYSRYFVGNK